MPVPRADGGESVHSTPDLKLSEEAFPSSASIVLEDDLEPVADAEEQAPEPSRSSRWPRSRTSSPRPSRPTSCRASASPPTSRRRPPRAGGRVRRGLERSGRGDEGCAGGRRHPARRGRRGAQHRRVCRPTTQRQSPSPTSSSGAAARGRDHRRYRGREVHRARRVSGARGRRGLERRDRPPPARDRRRACATRSSRSSARTSSGADGRPDRARIAAGGLRRSRAARLARAAPPSARLARVPRVARAARAARRAAAGLRHRGAAPLRGRRARSASTASS